MKLNFSCTVFCAFLLINSFRMGVNETCVQSKMHCNNNKTNEGYKLSNGCKPEYRDNVNHVVEVYQKGEPIGWYINNTHYWKDTVARMDYDVTVLKTCTNTTIKCKLDNVICTDYIMIDVMTNEPATTLDPHNVTHPLTTYEDQSDKQHNNTGMIVGIVIGVPVIAGIAVILWRYCNPRKQNCGATVPDCLHLLNKYRNARTSEDVGTERTPMVPRPGHKQLEMQNNVH
uniref:uncharacterized protein LOC131103026 isoform X2 n=1 Tax=Doryrhamphus excisus TaxID=161450 RepID=UPI0025AE2587|nr:uncharacterized protein LOC131103026 isoform X2 [Doryrhamphus excisus]